MAASGSIGAVSCARLVSAVVVLPARIAQNRTLETLKHIFVGGIWVCLFFQGALFWVLSLIGGQPLSCAICDNPSFCGSSQANGFQV